MARVPNASFPQIGAKAEVTPYSRVDPTAAAFGAMQGQAQESLGNAVAHLGEQGAAIITDINKENIQRLAKYGHTEYSKVVSNAMYGDGTDTNPGLLNLQGQAAIDARPGVMKQLAEARVQIGSKMDNQIAADLFNGAANETDETATRTSAMHVSQQRIVANETASNLVINQAHDDGALGSADPLTVHKSEIIVQQQAIQQAQAKGLSAEATLDFVKQHVSKYYEDVITNRMETNTKAAEDMLNSVTDRIGGTEASILTKRLEQKKRDDISLGWAVQEHNHTLMLQRQEQNYGNLISAASKGQAGLLDFQKAKDAQAISGPQLESLISFKDRMSKGGPGDPAMANQALIQVYDGQIQLEDISKIPGLNSEQTQHLVTVAASVRANGGINDSFAVKEGKSWLEWIVAAKKDITTKLDEKQSARLANADEEYFAKVALLGPGQATPGNIDMIKREVANNHLPDLLADPSTYIANVLPQNKYWPYRDVANRPEMKIRLAQGFYQLLKDKRSMDPAEFAHQGFLLNQYDQWIDKLQDSFIPQNSRVKPN